MFDRVEPVGPLSATVAVVGEAPGREELIEGEPFVGPSGQIMWPMLRRFTLLRRGEVRVLYWSDTPLDDEEKKAIKKDPSLKDERTAQLLQRLDAMPNLELVITMGKYSTEALLGPDYDMYWATGLAIPSPSHTWVVVPITHPAAGLHAPGMLEGTWHGVRGLKRYLETGETWEGWKDEGVDYLVSQVADVLHNQPAIAIDTEGVPGKPYCLSFSTDGHNSIVVYATDTYNLKALAEWLERTRPLVIMHNAVYDLKVLRDMGVDILGMGLEIRDTMVDAFVLQNVPRDLKSLAKRELGVPMKTYAEVVGPYQKEAEEEWRARVYTAALAHLKLEQQFTPKGKPRKSKGQDVFKLVGPPLQLKIHKHFERGQKFSLQEEKWGEAVEGPKPGLELSLVPSDVHVPYAGKDARVTFNLAPKLRQRVIAEELENVSSLDHAVIPLIDRMEETGLYFNPERYWEVSALISQKRIESIEKLKHMVGEDFNPGSADQVEQALREREYVLTKMTKSRKRFSTDSKVLKVLQSEYENTAFLDELLAYRELDKLEGTYVLPLAQLIDPDRMRLFPHIRGTTVVSGRLSASAPNVLAWPARSKLGLLLRSIFVAPLGKILVSWDLSQIELRLTAAFSGDPVMTEAFVNGLDLHTNLASKLFNVPYDEVDKFTQRTPSKLIHYLLLYGGRGAKLYEELRAAGVKTFTQRDCEELIEQTWETYRYAGIFLAGKSREARAKGYVKDFLGRRRFLPGVQVDEGGFGWVLKGLRLEAERQAGNFAIQAGAAEIIKRGMVSVWEQVYPALELRLWLQVHDELMGELPEDQWEEADARMKTILGQDSWLTHPIPIIAEGSRGQNWAALK